MTPEVIDKLQAVFAPVAAKIGEGAAYGWEIVVKQMLVESVGYSLATIVSMVLGFAFAFEAVAHVINPDYYAIQFFIGLVTPHASN